MPRPVAIAILVQLAIAAWFLTDVSPGTDAALRGLPVDDAWIHLVYGRAVLDSGLPAYNAGQLEAGFTSPLQVIVAATAEALSRLGVPVGTALKVLTLACTVPATGMAAAIATRRAGPFAGGIAAFSLALSPTIAFSGLSGMEVGLTGTLMLGTWLALDHDRPGLAGLLAGLAVYARPEAVLLVPLLAPALRWRLWPVLVGLGLWATYDLLVIGHPLPTTFYAKAESAEVGRLGVAASMLGRAWPAFGIGVGVLAWGAALVTAARRRAWMDLAWFTVPLVFIVAVALGRQISSTDRYFYFLRYFLPVEPLIAVALGVGTGHLLALRYGRPAWVAVIAVLGLEATGLPARRALYAWNCQNIEEMQGRVADWIRQNAPGARVASVDAGLIRYRADVEVRDVVGLNDHALLFERGLRRRILSDPAEMVGWMRAHDVDLLYTFPALLPFTAAEQEPERYFDIVLEVGSRNYTVAAKDQGRAFLLRPRPDP